MSDENGQPSQYTETDEIEDEEQSEEEQPHNDIQSEQVQQEMELPPHDGLMRHSPIQTVHIRDADTEDLEEPRHDGKRIKLRRLQDIRNIETPKSTRRNINKNKRKRWFLQSISMCEKEAYLNIEEEFEVFFLAY